MYLVSAMFDTLRNIDEFMETSMWKSCREYINRVSLWRGLAQRSVAVCLAGTGVEGRTERK